jgi:hypothetical protein
MSTKPKFSLTPDQMADVMFLLQLDTPEAVSEWHAEVGDEDMDYALGLLDTLLIELDEHLTPPSDESVAAAGELVQKIKGMIR